MTDNKWLAVDIVCPPESVDQVEAAIGEYDSLGIETDTLGKKPGEPIRVTAFFHELPEQEHVEETLTRYGLSSPSIIKISFREIEETDWLAEWKKYWRPTTVERFVIAPPWEDVDEPGKIVIKIEPNMAFGTGTHATTQLCLAAISRFYVQGQSFLDIGCGTGILSIAAAKLDSASPIAAYDTDVPSVEIATENARMNGVATRIAFFEGSIDTGTPAADFICANVTLDVILPMLDLLLTKAKNTLVLSGILVEQRTEIEHALTERGIGNAHVDVSGEWISVLVRA